MQITGTYIETYTAGVSRVYQQGSATEHTYRKCIQDLLYAFAPDITATNEPARLKCGAPNFILTRDNRPLGYIETKTLGKDLESEEYKEQFERYLNALSNLMITDYMRYHLLQTFDDIYIINLHGNARKKEVSPDGKDENIFNIQQFPVHSVGIVTARDNLTIQFKRKEMENIVSDFAFLSDWDARYRYKLGNDARDWSVAGAQADLKESQLNYEHIRKILYRPFDYRYTYYTGKTKGFHCMPRGEVMNNIAGIHERTGKKVNPKKLFDYIYAVLHSPKYRRDYEEFLKIDFPKIPYPADNAEFERFAKFGEKLRKLHLLEIRHASVKRSSVSYLVAGTNRIDNIRYDEQRVYINKTQYFGGVPLSAWEFYIGGYQPLQKYLKDRKGRTLSFEDIEHYQNIAAVFEETEKIMNEIG